MGLSNLFSELKRRNVYKVAVAYGITAWLLAQLAGLASTSFEAPPWVMKMVIVVLILGFPIALILAWAFEISPEGVIRVTSPAAAENPYTGDKKRPYASNVVIGILVLLLIGQFYYFQYLNGREVDTSIAVLPFINDSDDEGNLYFCNGIMNGILDHLARMGELTVVSRNSVEQFRHQRPSTKEIARVLGVEYIVDGSVQKVGDRVVISAQLIQTAQDKQLWSKRYQRNLSDVLEVQSEVADQIAEQLKVNISEKDITRTHIQPTTNIDAYDSYMRGMEYFVNFTVNRRPNDLDNALKNFQMAAHLDPEFGLAYSGQALMTWFRDRYAHFGNRHFQDSLLIMCAKGISLNPFEADTYATRGLIYSGLNMTSEAEKDLTRTLELNPNHPYSTRQLAVLRYRLGKVQNAFQLLRKYEKIERSPYQLAPTYAIYFDFYTGLGEWDKAKHYYDLAYEMNPVSWGEGDLDWYYEIQGRYEESLRFLESRQDQSSQDFLSDMAEVLVLLGKYEEAVTYFERLEEMLKNENPESWGSMVYGPRYALALIHTGREDEGYDLLKTQLVQYDSLAFYYDCAGISAFLGNKKDAYKYLQLHEQQTRWSGGLFFNMKVDPLFENLRADQKFQDLLERVLNEKQKMREAVAAFMAHET